MRRDVTVAECELRRDAVNPGNVRIGDELDRPVPGHELVQKIQRADPDIDPGGGKHDPVRVAGAARPQTAS